MKEAPCKKCPVLIMCINKKFVMCDLAIKYIDLENSTVTDERIREVGDILKKQLTIVNVEKKLVSFANWNKDEEAMEEEK